MIAPNQWIRTEVRFSDQEELNRIRQELHLSGAQDIQLFDSVIEATIDSGMVLALKKMGFLLDFPRPGDITFEDAAGTSASMMSLPSPRQPENDGVQLFNNLGSSKYLDFDNKTFTSHILASPREHHVPMLDGIESLAAEENLHYEHEDLLEEDAYLIEFEGPVREQWRERFGEWDARLRAFHDPGRPYTFSAFMNRQQLNDLQSMGITRSVKRYGLAQTITKGLVEHLNADQEAVPLTTFEAVLHEDDHLDRIKTFIASSGEAAGISFGANIIRFKSRPDSPLIAALVNMPYVAAIHVYTPPKLFCNVAQDMTGLHFPAGHSGYYGESEVVAVFDSGIDGSHPDLQDRLIQALSYNQGMAEDQNGHGTHVAGIICGNGTASLGSVTGIAPAAKLVSIGIISADDQFNLPVDLGELMKVAADLGASIINLSWGFDLKGEYHHSSFNIDRFAYDHPEILIVAAAGNEGEAFQARHSYLTMGVPGTAKNVLTVGMAASRRTEPAIAEKWGQRSVKFPAAPQRDEPLVISNEPYAGPAALSSRGPTDYDSIKPDVIAPGTYILAPKASGSSVSQKETYSLNENYTFKTGTSMAAPIVSGIAALVREYLRKEHLYLNPSSSVVKAIIIAAAQPIENYRKNQDESLNEVGFPDFDQGFGLINFDKLLNSKSEKLLFADVANNSDKALISRAPLGSPRKSSRQYDFETELEGGLQVVLTWLDPPARGVQNNLQLSLATPDNKWQLGNMMHVFKKSRFFDPAPGSSNVFPHDKSNTVEKISIASAAPGKYRLKVFAQSTISKAQGYSIAIQGKLKGELQEFIF